MKTPATITSFNSMFRDLFPRPGQRIKQWVVDTRRETEWERQTCPRIRTHKHDDNTGTECRNSDVLVPWTYLSHDCCSECGDVADEASKRDDVIDWRGLKAKRPPIEPDRSKLSNEIAPEPGVLRSISFTGRR